MKKSCTSLVLLIFFSSAIHAQLSKGQWTAGGMARISHDKSKESPAYVKSETTITAYEASPGIGYFFTDRFSAGLRFAVVGLTNKNEYSASTPAFTSASKAEITTRGIGISPYLRYYFLPNGKKVNLFADLSYAYTSETEKTWSIVAQGTGQLPPTVTESRSSRKLKGNSFMIAAGPAFFIGKNVSFDLTVGYGLKKDGDRDYTNNRIMFGTGFQVFFGK